MSRHKSGTIGDADGGALAALKQQMASKAAKSAPIKPRGSDFSPSTNRIPPLTNAARKALATVSTKKKKQVVRLRAGDAAAIYAGIPTSYSVDEAAIRLDAPVQTFKDAYEMVRLAQEEAEQGRVSVSKPASVSADTTALVSASIAAGASLAANGLPIGYDGFVIGYDFGTSSTKVVFRRPFNPAVPAFAVPVPYEMRSESQPHLWPTAIWIDEGGRLSILPSPGMRMIDGFKAALLAGNGHRYCKGGQLTYAEAAVGFLAMHLAYVIGAARETTSRTVFSIQALHIGIPVGSLTQGEDGRFSTVFSAALSVLAQAGNLTLAHVRSALTAPKTPPDLPFLIFPELVGLVSGYASGNMRPGAHMIIDCGAATLDLATFILPTFDGRPLPIHVARVDRLGADACAWAMVEGVSHEQCVKACQHAERLVYGETVTKKDRAGFSQQDDGYSYFVIAVGGGFAGPVHKRFAELLGRAFSRPFIAPALDAKLERDPTSDPGRLLLADGLARDPIQIRQWLLPDDKDYVAPTRWDFDAHYTSKDLC